MKLSTLIILIAFLQVSAKTLAQKVSLTVKDAPIATVFEQISDQAGYDFVYSTSDIKAAKPVTIAVKNQDLATVLKQIFDGQPLEYSVEDKSVIVSVKQVVAEPSQPKTDLSIDKIDVHGQVVGDDGLPLPGASVIIKGTSNSTITNAKGIFNLKGAVSTAIAMISFIGYDKIELPVSIDMGIIKLKPTENKLDEVQVIAYGQTTQRLSTGDISTVNAKTIENQPVSNPLLALEGQVPGVFVTQSSGLPGTGVTVNIMGQHSIGVGNDPLYVIDGVPYTSQLLPNLGLVLGTSFSGNSYAGQNAGNGSPFSFINPDDIESISILKDADATAIYGSRAANGAILIITKKGKSGAAQINFSVRNGWGKVAHFLDLMNTQQYLQMRHEAITNDGLTVQPTDYDLNGTWDTTRNTNWQKELIGGTAQYADYNTSISGGNENIQYLAGATFNRQTTVFPGNFADNKGSVYFNFGGSSANRKFKFSLSGNYLSDHNALSSTDLTTDAMTLAPDAPKLYNNDGTLNWMPNSSGTSTFSNPLAYLNNTYNTNTNNLISHANLSYELLPGLVLSSSLGYTNLQTNESSFTPLTSTAPENRATTQNGAQFVYNTISSWIIEPQLNYIKTLGKGKLDILLGGTIQQNNNHGQLVGGNGFTSDALLGNLGAASTVYAFPTVNTVYKYNAGFARINYNWASRYLLDLTVRRDGSSRFGSANQFHNFGAIGAGWIFSEEEFIKNNASFLSYGKIHASYGSTGNDQIGNYEYLSTYKVNSVGVPYQGVQGLLPNGLTNPFLQWELTRKLDIGIDLGFFNDRFLLDLDYYNHRSNNQLLSYNLPLTTGFPNIAENFPALVENKGYEMILNAKVIDGSSFKWTAVMNFTLPYNKLVSFPGLNTSTLASNLVIGQPITITKQFKYDGVDPATGIYRFIAADGTITSNPQFGTDETAIVNTAPKCYAGITNTIQYKSFTLTFLFQGAKQTGLNDVFGFGSVPGNYNNGYGNQLSSLLNRWQQPGENKPIEKYSSNFDLFLQQIQAGLSNAAYTDASYIRLKNLSIAYAFSKSLVDRLKLKSLTVFAEGENLWTITNYKGLDPEQIITYGSLPPLRVISLGIRLGLN